MDQHAYSCAGNQQCQAAATNASNPVCSTHAHACMCVCVYNILAHFFGICAWQDLFSHFNSNPLFDHHPRAQELNVFLVTAVQQTVFQVILVLNRVK